MVHDSPLEGGPNLTAHRDEQKDPTALEALTINRHELDSWCTQL